MTPSSKPDYAKWSLYLGGGSLLVGIGYFFWQYKNAASEAKWHRKYDETRKAIQDMQTAHGLYPSGKFDIPTQNLLKTLASASKAA
jgi:hypothetical protein